MVLRHRGRKQDVGGGLGEPTVTETSKGTVISLLRGAMGLDLAFDDRGDIKVTSKMTIGLLRRLKPMGTASVDFLKSSKTTSITSPLTVLEKAGLGRGEATVVIGAPPCEPHSTAGKRNGGGDSRADTIYDFIRIIEETRPLVFCMEEVKGFLSSSKKHLGFYDRVAMNPKAVAADWKPGSFFLEVMEAFKSTGYKLSLDENNPKASVLNAADYGVPQKRERFILIGVREGAPVPLPSPTHGPNGCKAKPHLTLGDARPWEPTARLPASDLESLPESDPARWLLEEPVT